MRRRPFPADFTAPGARKIVVMRDGNVKKPEGIVLKPDGLGDVPDGFGTKPGRVCHYSRSHCANAGSDCR